MKPQKQHLFMQTGLGQPQSLIRPTNAEDNPQDCELDFGDVVEHRRFGVGTIVDVEGDRLTIMFEEEGEKKVIGSFVDLIKPGHEKGIRSWNRKWNELVKDWQDARSSVNAIMPLLFRPRPEDGTLEQFLRRLKASEEAENAIRKRIEAFLHEEEMGIHK